MTCQDVRDRLSVWRDGEAAGSAGLSSEERASMSRHLDECVECRDALATLDRSIAGVRALPPPAPPTSVTKRALALGRKHADEIADSAELAAVSLPLPSSAMRRATVAERPSLPGIAAARSSAPAPTELRSSKRPSRVRLALIGLGLIGLLVLTAYALGFLF